jgi:hypothetical protein
MVKKCPSTVFNRFINFYIFGDIEARPTECEAGLYKVRSVLNFLVNKFQHFYVPEKLITIDECMIAWKDQLIFRVYMPDNPDRIGIKV